MVATNKTIENNPFAQEEKYQILTIKTSQPYVEQLENAFANDSCSFCAFEQNDNIIWKVEIMLAAQITAAQIDLRINLLKKAGIKIISWQLRDYEQRDWVSEIQAQFPPLIIGRFFIHGSHIKPKPAPAISLRIDAGRAFGTGEHETTTACLQAMQWLEKKHNFRNIIDIGCGTGILALAAKKIWKPAFLLGVDIDRISVEIAQENATDNKEPNIKFIHAADTKHNIIRYCQPYDLIVANILADPLVKLAPNIAASCSKGGFVILSGLLVEQKIRVLNSYIAFGFTLQKIITINNWVALIMRK